jgi:hypothetical protein
MTPEEAHANALHLISLRASGLYGTSIAFRDQIATHSGEVTALVGAILDVLGSAMVELRAERARVALWSKVAAIPPDESKPVEHRQAARLILAHNAFSIDDKDLASLGIGDFNQAVTVVNALERGPDTVLGIIDVWLAMLPELTAPGGAELLYTSESTQDTDT